MHMIKHNNKLKQEMNLNSQYTTIACQIKLTFLYCMQTKAQQSLGLGQPDMHILPHLITCHSHSL